MDGAAAVVDETKGWLHDTDRGVRPPAGACPDPALLETLQHLADAEPVADPFAEPADDVAELARTINRQRQTDRLSTAPGTEPGCITSCAPCPTSLLTDSMLTRSPQRHAPKLTVTASPTCWPTAASIPLSHSRSSQGTSPDALPSRTAPAARSIAFVRSCTWSQLDSGNLRDARALLTSLVTHHGFDVLQTWLERPHG